MHDALGILFNSLFSIMVHINILDENKHSSVNNVNIPINVPLVFISLKLIHLIITEGTCRFDNYFYRCHFKVSSTNFHINLT